MFNVGDSTNTYDYMNSFFGGLNSSSGTNNTSSLLGDYYSIQNGSYLKVAKQFYAKAETEKSAQTAQDMKKELSTAKESAEAAVTSVNKLLDDSLFKKVEKTDEKGNKTMDYDKDNILANVKSFVEKYNDLIKVTGEMEDTSTLKSAVRLVKQTAVYDSALAKVGISIEKDNTLKVDEEAFNKANMTDVKSLFTGGVSFGKNLQTKFLQIYSSASNNLNATGGLYSAQAKTAMSIGNMFDGML